MKRLMVALVQVNAGRDVSKNMAQLEKTLAALPSVDLIALPEVFAFRGAEVDYRVQAEPLGGPLLARVGELARRHQAWISAGSLVEADGPHVYNTSVLLDRSGRIRAAYRKIHLFEAYLENGRVVREAAAYDAGEHPVSVRMEGWTVGLAVCYDLRFPELFRHYAAAGAHLFLVPSNFTQRTGKDHWEILLRARAIENQCFVVAANQCGENPATHVASYGHSMAVGPWGDILCRAGGDQPEMIVAELNPRELEQTRMRIPALQHRRL